MEEANFIKKLQKGSRKYIGKIPFKCFNCGKIGHFQSKCPYPKKDSEDEDDKSKQYKKKKENLTIRKSTKKKGTTILKKKKKITAHPRLVIVMLRSFF